MKLELNFYIDNDGNHCVAISSPSCEKKVVQKIDMVDYHDIRDKINNLNTSEEDLKKIISSVAAKISGEKLMENIKIFAHKYKHYDKDVDLYALDLEIPNDCGGWYQHSWVYIDKETYTRFCEGSTMQKLNIAFHSFEEFINSGILDN